MGRRVNGGVLAAVAVLFFVYFWSSPDSRFEADDAYAYAAAVERADYSDTLNPYHPIHLPITKVLYTGASAISDIRALDFMVVMGSLLAAGAVVIFFFALRRWFDASGTQALFGATSLAASYIFWRYAGEAEVYAFATFAAALLLWAAVSWTPRPATIIGIAALAVLAVLAHTLNAALILVLPFVLRGRDWSWRRVAAAAGVAAALLGMAAVAVYETAKTSPYGPAPDTSIVSYYLGGGMQTALSPGDLLPGVGVLGSTFVGSNSLFVLEPTRDYLASAFQSNSMTEELVMGTTSPQWVGFLGLAAIVVLALMALLFIRQVVTAHVDKTRAASIAPAAIWCLAYFVLVAAGGTVTQPEVWALFPLPFWALITGLVTRREVKTWVLIAVPVGLTLTTVLSGLLPLYTGEDRLADRGRFFVTEGRSGDLVLTADSAGLARYISYESDVHAAHIGFEWVEEDAVEMIEVLGHLLEEGAPTSDFIEYLRSSGSVYGFHQNSGEGGRLFLTADMLEPPDWLATAFPRSAAALVQFGRDHRHLMRPADSTGYILERLP